MTSYIQNTIFKSILIVRSDYFLKKIRKFSLRTIVVSPLFDGNRTIKSRKERRNLEGFEEKAEHSPYFNDGKAAKKPSI